MSVEFERLARELATFPSAVLTARDASGYPYSVRCHSQPESATQSFIIEDVHAPLVEGMASLLCHEHDDHLWRQRSVMARGRIARAGGGWRFTPEKIIPGLSQNPLALVRFFLHGRSVAAAYLAKRGLPRPVIPWDDIIRIKREAQANLRARGERY
ncbi:MAG TPA: hypothetical protein VF808_06080 [Ktedonobacterales bacterium]